ncbi:hypothetical protein EH240_20625 [Mesorhizobium tamadayense]|uniref:Uncharacterized protein n=1 Tax=Mesorhizobium tamadayense TaxID=425306 RepID=A0A3P3FHG9_9HYPH|nr:hypothetical protein EH240_20625 [Mesorhizobium tamadayense]
MYIWVSDLINALTGMRRGILNFVGIKPARETLFGTVANASDAKPASWVKQIQRVGRTRDLQHVSRKWEPVSG